MDFDQANNSKEGIFINGKKQIIELLKYMNQDERNKLLAAIKRRNPSAAKKLHEDSLSIHSVIDLPDSELQKVLGQISPMVTGLALKLLSQEQQKRILRLLPRTQAEEAFRNMTRPTSRGHKDSMRAQEKMVDSALKLARDRVIQFRV